MLYLLNDEKIAKSKTDVDKIQLNAALELAYYFKKRIICSLMLQDVYDGKNILTSIRFDPNEAPRPTSEPLKAILQTYIAHLLNGISVDQNSPLFPVYWGENGGKKLQRHIKNFSDYGDFNEIKKILRGQSSGQLKADKLDSKSRIREISEQAGITERAVRLSLGEINNPSSSEYLSKKWRFVKLLDDVAVLPVIDALDADKVEKTLKNGWDLSEGFKESSKNNMMHILIMNIEKRVKEIEKELTEQETASHELEGKTFKDMLPNRLSVLNNENDNHIDEIEQEPSAQNNATPPSMYKPAPPVEITDEILTEEINALFNHIKLVRALVSYEEWEKWKEQQAEWQDRQAKLSSRSSNKPDGDSEEDDNIEAKLHAQAVRASQAPYIPKTRDEQKKEKVEYAKTKRIESMPDKFTILKNAIDLIEHTGLYLREIANLCIKHVVKSQYHRRIMSEEIQEDWIVDEIEPLPNIEYPRGSNAISIVLSAEAKNIIFSHIKFLQGIDPQYHSCNYKTGLFPLSFNSRSPQKKSPKPTKPKTISPEQSAANSFQKQLLKDTLINNVNPENLSYEQLRERGIRRYCATLLRDNTPEPDMVNLVKRFARYKDEKDARRIIDETRTYNDPA